MQDVQGVLRETEERMKKSLEVAQREFAALRAARASPVLVEHVKAEYYGTQVPLKQLATILAPEVRLLVIQPWDPSTLVAIERAILQSELGLTPQNDGKCLRLNLPPLSQERREELTKLARKMAEEARVAIRAIRREANESVKKLKDAKQVSEDSSHKATGEIQKLTDKHITQVDELLNQKERDLTTL